MIVLMYHDHPRARLTVVSASNSAGIDAGALQPSASKGNASDCPTAATAAAAEACLKVMVQNAVAHVRGEADSSEGRLQQTAETVRELQDPTGATRSSKQHLGKRKWLDTCQLRVRLTLDLGSHDGAGFSLSAKLWQWMTFVWHVNNRLGIVILFSLTGKP